VGTPPDAFAPTALPTLRTRFCATIPIIAQELFKMPWSVWVVALALLVQLSPYGSFLILILCSPFVAMNNYVWEWFPAATVSMANAVGVKAQYVWIAPAALGMGLLFMTLALRKPESSFYKNMAILLLGFLLAAAVSVYRFSGWAGV
jgi:hypothetical protein